MTDKKKCDGKCVNCCKKRKNKNTEQKNDSTAIPITMLK